MASPITWFWYTVFPVTMLQLPEHTGLSWTSVLEVVALVFGDRVRLGGFVSVTLLILALLLSRWAVRRLLERPYRRPERPGRHGRR